MKLRVLSRNNSSADLASGDWTILPASSDSLAQPRISGSPRYSGNNFFSFLVDARGVLMKEKKLLPEYLGLPLILGCASESLGAGLIRQSPDANSELELLRLST